VLKGRAPTLRSSRRGQSRLPRPAGHSGSARPTTLLGLSENTGYGNLAKLASAV
jgi:hypothetical protein